MKVSDADEGRQAVRYGAIFHLLDCHNGEVSDEWVGRRGTDIARLNKRSFRCIACIPLGICHVVLASVKKLREWVGLTRGKGFELTVSSMGVL